MYLIVAKSMYNNNLHWLLFQFYSNVLTMKAQSMYSTWDYLEDMKEWN